MKGKTCTKTVGTILMLHGPNRELEILLADSPKKKEKAIFLDTCDLETLLVIDHVLKKSLTMVCILEIESGRVKKRKNLFDADKIKYRGFYRKK